jgi:uncharacterized protein
VNVSQKKVVIYAGHEQQKRRNAAVLSYLYAGEAATNEDTPGSAHETEKVGS